MFFCNPCNPCELTMTITAIANGIANTLSDEDLELAVEVFSQLGDTLGTIALCRLRCSEHSETFHRHDEC